MADSDHIDDLPEAVPLFPLVGALLLPGAQLPLNIFEPRYLEMVDFALGNGRYIGLIQPRDGEMMGRVESPMGKSASLEKVGCLGRISQFEALDDGRYLIVLDGICRFELLGEADSSRPFRQGHIATSRFETDLAGETTGDPVDRTRFLKLLRDYADFAQFEPDWSEIEETGTAELIDICCMIAPFSPREKQALLEAQAPSERAEMLIAMAELEMARSGAGRSPLQ